MDRKALKISICFNVPGIDLVPQTINYSFIYSITYYNYILAWSRQIKMQVCVVNKMICVKKVWSKAFLWHYTKLIREKEFLCS